jgi:CRP-like cAMP-binding protein
MTVRSIRDLLETQPTFAGLDTDDLDVIAGCGRNVKIDAGTWLFREGAAAGTFFAIRAGRATIEIRVPQGGSLVLDTVGPGEVLGWSWLFPPYRWHFDARAAEDVHAVALDGECLRGKCADDPRLGYDLMQRFAQLMLDRLQSARVRLLDLYGPRGGR